MSVVILGIADLNKRLAEISSGLSDDSSNAIYLSAAQAVATRARQLAPLGDDKNPGRLRRSIRARVFRQGAVRRFGPGAYGQLQLQMKGDNNAYYGHIVESGRKSMSYAGQGKVGNPKKFFSWIGPSGYRFFARRVRGFGGRRFFEKAVTAAGPMELERAAARLQLLLKTKYGLA